MTRSALAARRHPRRRYLRRHPISHLREGEDRTRAQRRRRRPGRFRGGDGPQNAEMARRVVWSEAASFDLEEAAGYIARGSRYYAAAFVREVRAAARSLRVSSERGRVVRSEEHTSELQSLRHLVCRLLLE